MIEERVRARPRQSGMLHPVEAAASARNEGINPSVEIAVASNAPPYGVQPVLPPSHRWLRGAAMLDEEQAAARTQYAPRFPEHAFGVRNRAQRPGRL